jgi:rod shape-determining protein MreC
MEFLLNRYRNLMVLLLVLVAQLVLLAYQVKSNGEVRLLRVWAVGAVTPLARGVEAGRSGVAHFFSDYFVLLDVRDENKRLKHDLDRVSMENQYLTAELGTADRARDLAIFQQHSSSKTVAAHIFGNTSDSGAVFLDRGSTSGVQKGMAVRTPAGIVGKIVNVYPMASMMLEITHPNFAAGVISQKHHVSGTLKGQGRALVFVDDIPNEQTVDSDEWFYTSGQDLIFPKGIPAGQVTTVRDGNKRKDIYVTPSGFRNGLEEVLIIIEGVHAPIPDSPNTNQPVYLLPPPPDSSPAPVASPTSTQPGPLSDADRVLEKYKKLGEATNHVYGDRGKGAPDYNFTPKVPDPPPVKQPNPK